MLVDVIPILVKLEIRNGAPFVDISPTDEGISEKCGSNSPASFYSMPPKRRSKKSASRSETSAGAPLAPPVKANTMATNNKITLDRQACMGQRKYSEVVVETLKPTERSTAANAPSGSGTRPSGLATCSSQSSVTSSSVKSNIELPPLDKVTQSYFCGNPSVEKTTGLLHFYKQSANEAVVDDEITMLCMLGVPASVTCRDLMEFVSPMMDKISEIKIIRDSTPNQYMVLLKMKSHTDACAFYCEFNDGPFFAVENPEHRCRLVFVERVESVGAENAGSLPFSGLTELPTCAVCLERMDDDVLTILCNHSFHAKCLKQCSEITCPVCRYLQTPEVTQCQTCTDCDKTTDLWMCMVCGNIGCGRYAEAHAYQHFLKTNHTYTIEVGGDKVWDYVGDNYVHRLIQVGSDNKFVEIEGQNCATEGSGKNVESLQVEYVCLLTNQLEAQRHYFEDRLRVVEQSFKEKDMDIQIKISNAMAEIRNLKEENEGMKKKVKELSQEKSSLEKKNLQITTKMEKTQKTLDDEQLVGRLMRKDLETLKSKLAECQTERSVTVANLEKIVIDKEEQINDLIAHFTTSEKIKQEIGEEGVNASIQLGAPSDKRSPAAKTTRRGKK
ncbi:hypothetical protein L596_002624 [Steinernema carpocapsae]|uniref:BRCA1-associated protein n=1 Tax=Steinernema carpocapsae TaxID=34508 RepID=A0A4U8UPR8_STECR|nr:hypothetical protein L596_002624 [Steinernema carpocapsae]